MADAPRRDRKGHGGDGPASEPPSGGGLPIMGPATSQYAEIGRGPVIEPTVAPRTVERGVVVFDLDGTVLNDLDLISHVAANVLHEAFATPFDEARIHYLATTGMPFEAQLAQLYPAAPVAERAKVARLFHERKIREAYAHASPFPEVPRLLKTLGTDGWTLVISTGAEREMADLVLEREGIRYWFEDVLGSATGTKREHLVEYQRRFPGVPMFLVGDSRFDMEAASSVSGVVPVARASQLPGWTLTPDDLTRWGARWAEYSLAGLPAALPKLVESALKPARAAKRPRRGRRGRDRDSPKAGDDPASL